MTGAKGYLFLQNIYQKDQKGNSRKETSLGQAALWGGFRETFKTLKQFENKYEWILTQS